ncbi:MAG: high frequency lysogenization protein HflD [Aeromonadaceae bacterium]|nr:high frequency lysogenization protein HflD [Aeromonadaceae bacterium]
MSNVQTQRTMAFAGICQAAFLVQQVARQGQCDDDALRQALNSILVTDPDHPEAVFGDRPDLRDGYQALITQLGNGERKDPELTRYVVSLVALERKLAARKEMLSMLGERITQVKRQCHHFDLLDEPVLANLASIYSEIISPLGPRIQVAGTPLFLQQPAVQHKVRALLLAGIRACVLWRQLGGRRRHILFARRGLVETARNALNRH